MAAKCRNESWHGWHRNEVGMTRHEVAITPLQNNLAWMPQCKLAWKPQLLNDEQYNKSWKSHTSWRRAVCSCRSVLEAQEWTLKVGMEDARWFELHRGAQNMCSQEWIASRPRESQDEMIIFTSHGREEVLTTIKMHRSAQQKNAQECWRLNPSYTRVHSQ